MKEIIQALLYKTHTKNYMLVAVAVATGQGNSNQRQIQTLS